MEFLLFLWEAFRRTGRVGLAVALFMAVLVLALPAVWLGQAVWGSFSGGPGPVVLQAEPDVVVDGVSYQAPDLTREASIYRESLLHMGTVIASIPTPTPTIVAVAEADRIAGTPVVAVLLDNPEGVSIERGGGHLDWFSPDSGLDFFRERGGDWTAPEVREASPFRTLVEYSGYPDGVSHFADGSMVYELAVKLAFGMVEVRPSFGTPTPAMIASLSRDLGWEMLDVDGVPAFRVWSNFRFRPADTAEYWFGVGGVMVMNVGELHDGSQYLIVGDFVPPGVVLQRLDVGS